MATTSQSRRQLVLEHDHLMRADETAALVQRLVRDVGRLRSQGEVTGDTLGELERRLTGALQRLDAIASMADQTFNDKLSAKIHALEMRLRAAQQGAQQGAAGPAAAAAAAAVGQGADANANDSTLRDANPDGQRVKSRSDVLDSVLSRETLQELLPVPRLKQLLTAALSKVQTPAGLPRPQRIAQATPHAYEAIRDAFAIILMRMLRRLSVSQQNRTAGARRRTLSAHHIWDALKDDLVIPAARSEVDLPDSDRQTLSRITQCSRVREQADRQSVCLELVTARFTELLQAFVGETWRDTRLRMPQMRADITLASKLFQLLAEKQLQALLKEVLQRVCAEEGALGYDSRGGDHVLKHLGKPKVTGAVRALVGFRL